MICGAELPEKSSDNKLDALTFYAHKMYKIANIHKYYSV